MKDERRFAPLESPDRHKLAAIRSLLRRFPARRFVLVGDAAERDPEIYGVIARESPTRIDRIWIRRVPGDGLTGERWRRALGDAASKARWFARPSEIAGSRLAR